MNAWHGLLVIDKPHGITSRAAADRAQRWFPRCTRLGHTGTLDPLATGVLVLCVGSATRLAEYVQQLEKVYEAGIRLGAISATDDADGAITPVAVARPPEAADVEAALRSFVGAIEQAPPHYSAARVGGRRAYSLARAGAAPALAPRRIHIHDILLHRYAYPDLDIQVRCGKGTYIRALARDLGEKLGCGGYIQSLRRTRVGPFTLARALPLDADRDTARQALLPLAEAVCSLPAITLPHCDIARLRQGQAVAATVPAGAECAVFSEQGQLVAVCTSDHARHLLHPHKVL